MKFLYKFIPGVSPESFGIYVAKMAGIDSRVLKVAEQKANEFNTKLDILTKKVKASKK